MRKLLIAVAVVCASAMILAYVINSVVQDYMHTKRLQRLCDRGALRCGDQSGNR